MLEKKTQTNSNFLKILWQLQCVQLTSLVLSQDINLQLLPAV